MSPNEGIKFILENYSLTPLPNVLDVVTNTVNMNIIFQIDPANQTPADVYQYWNVPTDLSTQTYAFEGNNLVEDLAVKQTSSNLIDEHPVASYSALTYNNAAYPEIVLSIQTVFHLLASIDPTGALTNKFVEWHRTLKTNCVSKETFSNRTYFHKFCLYYLVSKSITHCSSYSLMHGLSLCRYPTNSSCPCRWSRDRVRQRQCQSCRH